MEMLSYVSLETFFPVSRYFLVRLIGLLGSLFPIIELHTDDLMNTKYTQCILLLF